MNANPKIIPIVDVENHLFDPLSSSLNFPLNPSSLSINVRPILTEGKIGEKFEIFGQINPKQAGQSIKVLISHESELNTVVKSVLSDEFGNYKMSYSFDGQGKYVVQSVWMGNEDFFASESKKIVLNVGANSYFEKLEVFETYRFGLETLEIPVLNDFGRRIFRVQPVKELFVERYSLDSFVMETQVVFFGNEKPYLTRHNITIPSYEKQFFEAGEVVTRIVPEEIVEIINYRDKLRSKMLLSFVVDKDQLNFSVKLLDSAKFEELVEESSFEIVDVSNLVDENRKYSIKAFLDENEFVFEMFEEGLMIFEDVLDVYSLNDFGFNFVLKYEPDCVPSLIVNDVSFENSKYFFSNY